jgi:GAF domain-containing protein
MIMADSSTERSFDPEIESARRLLQALEAQRGNPELLLEIIDLLGNPTNTLEEFLQQLLNKINELIPSTSSLIGLVVSDSELEGPKVIVKRRDHQIGALVGNHDHTWSDFLVGGEELALDQRSLIGYVAFRKQSTIVPDVQKWKEETGFYQEVHEDIKSEIAVPILFEDRDVLGVINLESAEENHYKDEHMYQLQWVARMISRVLDAFMNRAGYRKPYLTVLDRVHKELHGLRINPDLSDHARKYLSEDSKAVFDSIASKIASALNSERCGIWVLTKGRDELLLEGQYSAEGPTEAATTRELEMAMDAMKKMSSLYLDCASSPNGEQVLIAPLLVSGRAYGVIMIKSPKNSRGPHCYTIGDERLLDVLQQPIAIAIHQKHLEWERRATAFKRGKDVAVLLDIISGIDLDLATVLHRACDKTLQLCKALHCTIFTLDDTTSRLVRRATTTLPEGFIDKPFYKLGEGLTGWVGQNGKPLNLRTRHDQDLLNIQPSIDWNNEEKLRHRDLIDRPFIAVPIQLRGRTVGVLRCTDKYGEGAVFTEADEQILLLIAAHIATAFAFHQRYEGQMKLFSSIKSILDFVKKRDQVPETSNFEDTLLNKILEAAQSVFGADVVIAYRYRNGEVMPNPIKSGRLKYEEYFGNPIDEDSMIFEMLKSTEEIHYFPNAMTNLGLTGERSSKTGQQNKSRFVVREDICSSVVARIGSGGGGKGMLFLNYRDHPRTFNKQFDDLLIAFTDIVSLCIDLFDMRMDSMDIAAHLHNAIIPELVRDVVAEAGFGNIQLQRKNYNLAGEYLYAIEGSAQRTVAALSDVVRRLIVRFALGT